MIGVWLSLLSMSPLRTVRLTAGLRWLRVRLRPGETAVDGDAVLELEGGVPFERIGRGFVCPGCCPDLVVRAG